MDLEPDPTILSCDKVRTLLRRLFDSGEVKVTHWHREHGVNSNSYGRFMKLKGPYTGIDNQTYEAGYQYFRKRQLEGVKDPNPNKKAKTSEAGKNGTKPAKGRGTPDVSDITLLGEDNDAVEVFDTCDDVRRKISAFLRRNDVVQAQFLRDLGAQYHTESSGQMPSQRLNAFRQKTGPNAGATSKIFYAAYVYFEKLRIKEGKPKSEKRLEMENRWGGEGGFDRTRDANTSYFCSADSAPQIDGYGQLHIGSASASRKPKKPKWGF